MKKTIAFEGAVFWESIRNQGSGVYFVALNLLNEFLKNDAISVYVCYGKVDKVLIKRYLEEKIGRQIEFYPPVSFWDIKTADLLLRRKQYKAENKKIKKFIVDCTVWCCSFFNRKKKQGNFDCLFSVFHLFDKNIVGKKHFLFLHDTIPLIMGEYAEAVESWKKHYLRAMNAESIYFANSQNTKQDFLRFFPQLKQEQIIVTPLAAKGTFRKITDKNLVADIRKKYRIPENKKYIFSLCTLEPRKNLLRAVRTFVEFVRKNQIEDMVFVLGGGAWKDFIVQFEKELGTLPENLIYRAGYVAEEDLPALYSGAEWFVYTSQYEGFGLPPLEAMQCGCPVITSNNSSLPEVVGDAGIMIDFDSDGQHVKAYETYYFDETYRQEMAEKGLERAKLFSWEKTADIILGQMLK